MGSKGGHPKKSGFKGGGGTGKIFPELRQTVLDWGWVTPNSMKIRGGHVNFCWQVVKSHQPPTPLKMNGPLEGNLSKKTNGFQAHDLQTTWPHQAVQQIKVMW